MFCFCFFSSWTDRSKELKCPVRQQRENIRTDGRTGQAKGIMQVWPWPECCKLAAERRTQKVPEFLFIFNVSLHVVTINEDTECEGLNYWISRANNCLFMRIYGKHNYFWYTHEKWCGKPFFFSLNIMGVIIKYKVSGCRRVICNYEPTYWAHMLSPAESHHCALNRITHIRCDNIFIQPAKQMTH